MHALQPYTINSAEVIFLKLRPHSRPFTCDRIVQEPFQFRCLSH
jgi:hypothetical protein